MTRSEMEPRLGNERGVALPLALLGLVSVSLLVTTALVTSSTELAISDAQQDATQALYTAEGGLQAFVAQNGTVLGTAAGAGPFTYTPPDGSGPIRLEVIHLGDRVRPDESILSLYSVSATPTSGGGRTVMTTVPLFRLPPVPLDTHITSAMTMGDSLSINGNAFTVSGRSLDPSCGPSVMAARMAEGAEVVAKEHFMDNFVGTDSMGVDVEGAAAIERAALNREELAADVLGGRTIEELITQLPASKKWGPRFTPPGDPPRVFDGTVDSTEYVAVVDADGGTVVLNGGSGMLIIVNGNLEMGGSATFDGIILVEGSFWLHGTPQVTGALISLSYDAVNRIDLDLDAEISGHVTVQYDRCQIQNATENFEKVAQEAQVPQVRRTLAWLEVVR